MALDGWELAAGCLRAEEAEMLAELLESAGISTLVEDSGTAGVLPLLQGGLGGARVLVPAADASRAREIVASSGVFRGAPGVGEEIPDAEWEAPAAAGEDVRPEPRADDALRDRRVAAIQLLLGVLFLAALVWLAIAAPRKPELPDMPSRTPPAQRSPSP